ncbi:MAG TPA: murein biosynthesis integral membrane protein MurJ [Jatrophihabitantaceae bacterium]|jgi:putative peptidoglycan lipid II flippase|nr:murein biosynthesis integral membrane protein MurJ [Jatrophihabitantaceae bacterium]
MSMPDGWSTPSLYSGRSVVQPPMVSGADPMTGILTADWDDVGHAHPQWSNTTYVGPRRHRPRGAPAPSLPPTEPAEHPAEPVASELALGLDSSAEQASPEAGNRGLLAASRTMAVANLTSRITGFLRSAMLVAAIGIGLHGVGDAYNVANNFPNMVYELLLGGVLSSVLIPLLVRAQESDEDDGVAYTQRLLSIATAALAAVTLLAVICAPLIAGAFVTDHSQRTLTTTFATLLLPEIFFYGLGAMFMAVLNIRHSYAPGAWSSVLNNVVMIVTIAVFWALPGPKTLTPASITTPQLLVLGIGTTLGIAAQALVLIPSLRKTGFRWQWRFRARPNEIGRMGEVGSLAGWVFGYVVASQIGVTVIAKVGVAHGAFTVFTNADLLIQMPYGILVVSLLTALMPRLSRAAARGQTDDVVDDLSLGARLSAIALVPITAGLIVLGPALCVVLFAHGIVSVDGARLVGTALAASAFGLFPFAIVMLQLRVFYAMRDGRTPTFINIFMVATKVLIVLVCDATLHGPAHIAEALTVATSASYVVGAIAGHVLLTRRLGRLGFGRVLRTVRQIGIASVAGGAVALVALVGISDAAGRGLFGSLAGLVVGGLAGLAVLGAVAWRMRIPEVRDIVTLARRR